MINHEATHIAIRDHVHLPMPLGGPRRDTRAVPAAPEAYTIRIRRARGAEVDIVQVERVGPRKVGAAAAHHATVLHVWRTMRLPADRPCGC